MILGLGATRILTFPLWEAKLAKTLAIFHCGKQKVLKKLEMLIVVGLVAPELLTFPLWRSKSAKNASHVNNVNNVFNSWAETQDPPKEKTLKTSKTLKTFLTIPAFYALFWHQHTKHWRHESKHYKTRVLSAFSRNISAKWGAGVFWKFPRSKKRKSVLKKGFLDKHRANGLGKIRQMPRCQPCVSLYIYVCMHMHAEESNLVQDLGFFESKLGPRFFLRAFPHFIVFWGHLKNHK